MAANTYRIRIVKPDFEFEAEGDKAFVQQMFERYGMAGKSIESAQDTTKSDETGNRIASSDKAMSVGEFVRKLEIKKHTDLVLAFGYYLEKFSDGAEFTPADINQCYYDAKMENSNTSQMIILNIKSGRMMEAKKPKGSKGRRGYLLTRTGEEFVEQKLAEKQD
ncbi:MAG: hypothetical protein IT364_20245 [Candidatus Hydrogenedentes bacterium]|nr:hypothetical protein [Candidatus Hydrogenedentota bacterium]